MSTGEQQARKIVERALAGVARHAGAEAEVSLTDAVGGHTRFAVNQVTTSADVETRSLAVRVRFGQRTAAASTNQLDDAAIAEVVARAVRLARLAPENPESMPPLGSQRYVAVPGAIDPATARAGAAERVRAPTSAIAQAEAAKVTIAGFYQHWSSSHALGTSAGLWAYAARTNVSYSCTARTADGTGSGWAGSAGKGVGELDVAALAQVAIDKAVRSAQPRRLDAGKYTVVMEPQAVASLLRFMLRSMDARRADEGRSFFARPGGGNRVGERLFPETITVRSDPTDVAVGGEPFDGDGLARKARRWIDKGAVGELGYTRYWAHKQGKVATGDDDGFTLDGGGATVDELIKGVERGVLISRVWYLRTVDPQSILVTGLTRDGTFLIERGAIVGPVNSFRFNHSPVTMLAKCDGLGVPVVAPDDDGAPMRVPALRTHDFDLASVSEAV